MSDRKQHLDDDRFIRKLLLFTFAGLLLLVVAIVAVSFFSANTPGDETVMHWRPPLMSAETADGQLVERLTQRWIAYVALAALLVSIISAVTLILTLFLQVRSSRAAVATFDHNRAMGETQTRAHVHMTRPGLAVFNDNPTLALEIENFGLSAAYRVFFLANVFYVLRSSEGRRLLADERLSRDLHELPPRLKWGQTFELSILRRDLQIHYEAGNLTIHVTGFMSYRDIFDEEHTSRFDYSARNRAPDKDGIVEMQLGDSG